ncbi:MAG: hypothetical protein V7637_2357 [Mycobacteriales bacterium]|jgi:hypothetical protein
MSLSSAVPARRHAYLRVAFGACEHLVAPTLST